MAVRHVHDQEQFITARSYASSVCCPSVRLSAPKMALWTGSSVFTRAMLAMRGYQHYSTTVDVTISVIVRAEINLKKNKNIVASSIIHSVKIY